MDGRNAPQTMYKMTRDLLIGSSIGGQVSFKRDVIGMLGSLIIIIIHTAW